MAIATFGQILEFNEKLEDWIQYFKWLEHLFNANDIGYANKKSVILLTVTGQKAYKLLWTLVVSERLEDKSYTDLVEAMKKHHNPKPPEIMEWHQFFR